MKNGSDINEALENSPDPGMIESLLSPAQREVVQDYKRRQMEEQYAAMTAEVKARFVIFPPKLQGPRQYGCYRCLGTRKIFPTGTWHPS